MLYWMKYFLMDKDGDGGGGGGGKKEEKTPVDHSKDIGDLRKIVEAQQARLDAYEAKEKDKGKSKDDDPDLKDKAKKSQDEKDKQTSDTAALQSAIEFSLGSAEFLKTNASLLPKDIEGIFAAAEKETYANAIEKSSAIKAAIVQSFFAVQANMDLLTPGLKSALEEYLKLTKNVKQDRAPQIYGTVFEPAFEMLKRVKKAEQLQRGGERNSSTAEENYKKKMIDGSKKHYLGEKANA